MAARFAAAGTGAIRSATSVSVPTKFTIYARFRPQATSASNTLSTICGLANPVTDGEGISLIWGQTNNTYRQCWTWGSSYPAGKYTNTFTLGIYYDVGVTYDGTTLIAYLDGFQNMSTAATAPSAGTLTPFVGCAWSGGGYVTPDFDIAHAAVWNVCISPQEMLALMRRTPAEIRPGNLMWYPPLEQGKFYRDAMHGAPNTIVGTTAVCDDPIFRGIRRPTFIPAATAGGGSIFLPRQSPILQAVKRASYY